MGKQSRHKKVVKGPAEQTEYTVVVNRVNIAELTVETDPADALFTIYDKDHNRIWPEEVNICSSRMKTIVLQVTKSGYVTVWHNISEPV